MKLTHVPGIDPPERDSFGSSSMSGYDEDLGDLELDVRKERLLLDVLPHIMVNEVDEDEEYQDRYQ